MMITLKADEVDSIHAAFIYGMKEFTEEDIHRAIRVGAEYQLEDITRFIVRELQDENSKTHDILLRLIAKVKGYDPSTAEN